MRTRARIVVALGLLAVVALGVVIVWLDSQDWKKLLLFGGIVGVAAWGWGREVPATSKQPVDEAIAADGSTPEETAR
jgi:hypothetical protein